jgi:outer membrane receptor protein involved in Fe transport
MSMNNQAYAVYDVDGILYTDCPTFIDPQQIKSITILRSLAATNRYGGAARGGAIVIRLKVNN